MAKRKNIAKMHEEALRKTYEAYDAACRKFFEEVSRVKRSGLDGNTIVIDYTGLSDITEILLDIAKALHYLGGEKEQATGAIIRIERVKSDEDSENSV